MNEDKTFRLYIDELNGKNTFICVNESTNEAMSVVDPSAFYDAIKAWVFKDGRQQYKVVTTPDIGKMLMMVEHMNEVAQLMLDSHNPDDAENDEEWDLVIKPDVL